MHENVYQRPTTPSEAQHEQRIRHFRIVFLGDVSVCVRGQILLSVDPPSGTGRAGARICHFRRIAVMTLREVAHEQPPVVDRLAKSESVPLQYLRDEREQQNSHFPVTFLEENHGVFWLTVSDESLNEVNNYRSWLKWLPVEQSRDRVLLLFWFWVEDRWIMAGFVDVERSISYGDYFDLHIELLFMIKKKVVHPFFSLVIDCKHTYPNRWWWIGPWKIKQ